MTDLAQGYAPGPQAGAYYQAIGLELRIDALPPLPPHDPHRDVLDGIARLSPWLRLLRYRWPVRRIARPGDHGTRQHSRPACWHGARPTARSASPNWRRWPEIRLWAGERSGRALLLRLAAEHGHDPSALLHDGAALLERMPPQDSALCARAAARPAPRNAAAAGVEPRSATLQG